MDDDDRVPRTTIAPENVGDPRDHGPGDEHRSPVVPTLAATGTYGLPVKTLSDDVAWGDRAPTDEEALAPRRPGPFRRFAAWLRSIGPGGD